MIGSDRRPPAVVTPAEEVGEDPERPPIREDFAVPRRSRRGRRLGRWQLGTLVVLGLSFALTGAFGIFRYVDTFWLYRGYAPPSRPSSLTVGQGHQRHKVKVGVGTVATISFKSPSLGGRDLSVIVYTPPGYADNPREHYPVLYLLHGFPGSPSQFIDVGDVAVLSDTLIAAGHIRPMIIVMPTGSTGFFSDEEWANSPRPGNNWENYIADDLVQTIDHRYRAIDNGRERGIGGLSEGGYGALNIGFHHVGEFDLMEAWSPYFNVDDPRLFGRIPHLIFFNSPEKILPLVTKGLRHNHVYIWMYTGTLDHTSRASLKFADELDVAGIASKYQQFPGHHNWHLWRSAMTDSLTIASNYFLHGPPTPKPA